MSTRYDIKSWRKSSQGKPYTVRIGSAWTDNKGVLRLAFDALPLPDENGQVGAFLEEQKPREQSAPSAPPAHGGSASRLDDDIPFAPEMRG